MHRNFLYLFKIEIIGAALQQAPIISQIFGAALQQLPGWCNAIYLFILLEIGFITNTHDMLKMRLVCHVVDMKWEHGADFIFDFHQIF